MTLSGGEHIGFSPDEADEDSTENVIELLRKYDQELVRHDKIDPEDTEDYLLTIAVTPDETEFLGEEAREEAEKTELEDFTRVLRSTLNVVGLADPASVTPESVQGISQELLEQLDPYNAESLYFEVASKVHKRLGPYEPVSWRRLLEQAQPENRSVRDLDNLQLKQRIKALGYLIELGIDPNQIKDMVKSSAEEGVAAPSRRQNVNRMAYFFQEEPLLDGLVDGLRKRVKSDEEPIRAERAIKMGQVVLRLRSERFENQRSKQASLSFDNERRWDSVDYDVYRKVQRRIRSSIAISNLILAEMRISTIDELLDEI